MPHTDLDRIGICNGCQKIVSMEHYAQSDGDETWKCMHCGAIVDHASFGYDRPDGSPKKVRWVGPDGKWVSERPQEHFNIGELTVYVKPPRFAF